MLEAHQQDHSVYQAKPEVTHNRQFIFDECKANEQAGYDAAFWTSLLMKYMQFPSSFLDRDGFTLKTKSSERYISIQREIDPQNTNLTRLTIASKDLEKAMPMILGNGKFQKFLRQEHMFLEQTSEQGVVNIKFGKKHIRS